MKRTTLHVEIEATNQCNTRCLHCPHEEIRRPTGMMDWQSFEIIAGKIMAASGDFSVEYAGMGEPLLNSSIYDFIRYITPRGFTSLTTNASALIPRNSERLIEAGLGMLTVSFTGADADTYEMMMGGLDFDRAVRNIKTFVEMIPGTSTGIRANVSVTRQTQDHLGEIRDYLHDLGIEAILFSKCHNRGGFLKSNLICATPPPPVDVYRCDILANTLFVSWTGKVLSCCHDLAGENVIGDLKTEELHQILSRREQILDEGVRFNICKDCNDLARFMDDQTIDGQPLSELVYNLYTRPDSESTGLSSIDKWLLLIYDQERQSQKMSRALAGEIHRKNDEIQALRQELEALQTYNQQINEELVHLRLIRDSRSWQLMTRLHEIRHRVIPIGSRREALFLGLLDLPRKLEAKKGLVSYEAVVAERMAQTGPEDFFFIQIGAYDGITNDPAYPYVVQHGWRGILVEPQPDVFQTLRENYNDQPQLVLVNAAISSTGGTRELYRVGGDGEDLPDWRQQIASFRFDNVLKHGNEQPDIGVMDSIPGIEERIEALEVPCLTFDMLLDEYEVRKIDLLQIDVEGYDYEIIRTIDFKRVKPAIIHYEHIHLKAKERRDCERLLAKQGYRLVVAFADTTAYLG